MDWQRLQFWPGVDTKQMSIYISYLIKVGFLPAPTGEATSQLPDVEISEETLLLIRAGAGGRSSAA